MSTSMAFSGFPREGLEFLHELADNNDRDWFAAHKARYQRALLEPAQAFVIAVGSRLQALDPAIQYDTRPDGRGVLMRFHRDTRFSADKSPFKTSISGLFTDGQGKKTERPAFGFHLTPDNLGLMAGIFHFPKPLLAAYRAAVAGERMGEALEAAVAGVRAAGTYEVAGEHYKRVPTGFDSEHPRGALLRYAGLYAYPSERIEAGLTQPELVDVCLEHFRNLAPVYHWLQGLVTRAA